MRIRRIATVAHFEFSSVVKRWSYLIATFGLPIFLALVSGTVLGVQTYFLTQRAAESSNFGLVDEAGIVDRSAFEDRDGTLVWTANANDVVLYDNRDAATKDLGLVCFARCTSSKRTISRAARCAPFNPRRLHC